MLLALATHNTPRDSAATPMTRRAPGTFLGALAPVAPLPGFPLPTLDLSAFAAISGLDRPVLGGVAHGGMAHEPTRALSDAWEVPGLAPIGSLVGMPCDRAEPCDPDAVAYKSLLCGPCHDRWAAEFDAGVSEREGRRERERREEDDEMAGVGVMMGGHRGKDGTEGWDLGGW